MATIDSDQSQVSRGQWGEGPQAIRSESESQIESKCPDSVKHLIIFVEINPKLLTRLKGDGHYIRTQLQFSYYEVELWIWIGF